jgi:predicted Zn-dependent peptidase
MTREDANHYYAMYYAPNNLSASLVGDFDPKQAKEFAKKYFGRLQRAAHDPEPVRTTEPPQLGEQRMTAYAETSPEVRIRYHTVADGHRDEPALVILSALLNDRTGRLYKSMVLEQQVASQASAGHNGMKYEGYFELRGVARPGKTPEEVEKALYAEIEKLRAQPPGERELQKVKNQIAASEYRRLESPSGLRMQLLIAEAYRGWQSLNQDPARLQAVTAADVQRVAGTYFQQDNRNVLTFYRKGGAK